VLNECKSSSDITFREVVFRLIVGLLGFLFYLCQSASNISERLMGIGQWITYLDCVKDEGGDELVVSVGDSLLGVENKQDLLIYS
jgi:hypothetical protein